MGRSRKGETLPDEKLQALSAFVEAMIVSRANPGQKAVDAFLAVGYTETHVLGVVLGIACKTFSNYVNPLAGTPLEDAFEAYKVD